VESTYQGVSYWVESDNGTGRDFNRLDVFVVVSMTWRRRRGSPGVTESVPQSAKDVKKVYDPLVTPPTSQMRG
jgi:hypothetical protein